MTDGGPNSGLYYAGSSSDATTYKYMIHRELLDASDVFYQSQWGTFNALTNPAGYIDGATLLRAARDHEYGATAISHYSNYTNGLKEPKNDVLVATEGAVSNTEEGWTTAFNQAVAAAGNSLYVLFKNEPCNGGISPAPAYMMFDSANNCVPIGRVNLPPYAPHP